MTSAGASLCPKTCWTSGVLVYLQAHQRMASSQYDCTSRNQCPGALRNKGLLTVHMPLYSDLHVQLQPTEPRYPLGPVCGRRQGQKWGMLVPASLQLLWTCRGRQACSMTCKEKSRPWLDAVDASACPFACQVLYQLVHSSCRPNLICWMGSTHCCSMQDCMDQRDLLCQLTLSLNILACELAQSQAMANKIMTAASCTRADVHMQLQRSYPCALHAWGTADWQDLHLCSCRTGSQS